MTYDQIVMLDSIVKAGSFKAASELLHKSQPSLSVGIKKIEEEFGINLFSREGYRPVLTPEGRAFYERARICLETFQGLENFATELGSGIEPEIQLALDALCPIGQIRDLLYDSFFTKDSTSLELSIETLQGTYEKVIHDQADLGIGPLFSFDSKLERKLFMEIEMLPVISKKILGDEENISPERLLLLPQIVVKDSGKSGLSDGLLEHGKKWYTDDNATKRELIIQGLGWGRLPRHAIQEFLDDGSLVHLVGHQVKATMVKLYLFRKKLKPKGPMAKELWDRLDQLTQK